MWEELVQRWRADTRGVVVDRAYIDRARLAETAEQIDEAAFTRVVLVESTATPWTLRRHAQVAYKFSEGRVAHRMILLYADRVDAAEHHLHC
jgi:hypothetical protein